MSDRKLALFDMDGTLFDTAEVNFLSYHAAASKLGYDIARDKFMEVFVGRNYRDFLSMFEITSESDLQFIHGEKKRLYKSFLGKAKVNWALLDIMSNMPGNYVKALVTTASRENAMDILREYHLENAFDFMITQEDAARLKPDPQAYIMAMEKAGIDAAYTVIFEDSEVGIQAAEATGASIMQIRRF
ncbi:MAG: HAD family phosphatase [Pseudobutyrivibrio sp.]|nr:HAD family phosphatase [Pseudobutyrivibrio sp.]